MGRSRNLVLFWTRRTGRSACRTRPTASTWMPDAPQVAASAQNMGKKGEEGGSVKDLPAALGKKKEEDRSGKDRPDSPAKSFAEMAKAPPSRTGDGTRAEAAAAAVTAAATEAAATDEAAAALRRLHARVTGSGRVALDEGGDENFSTCPSLTRSERAFHISGSALPTSPGRSARYSQTCWRRNGGTQEWTSLKASHSKMGWKERRGRIEYPRSVKA